MGIDIYILNLPRVTHRLTLCRQELYARGIPIEKIHTWVANDDRDYEKTHQVCEAAIADGFPKYQSFLDRGEHNRQNIAIFTQSWNYCRFFRHLKDEQKPALLIHDDMRLIQRVPVELYGDLNKIVDFLQNQDEIFYFLALWPWYKEAGDVVLENPHILRGIYRSGADLAQVITPQGAELLLSRFEGYYPPRLESFLEHDLNQTVGFYTMGRHSPIRCEKFIEGSSIHNDKDTIIAGHPFIRPIKTTRD